jgi:DNA-binding beta-propeller fold protein YncE
MNTDPIAPSSPPYARAAAALAALVFAAGCPADASDVGPPRDQIFFPAGMAMSPDESVLFVVNANSELKHNRGAVSVIDLDLVDALLAGEMADECVSDASAILQCNERAAIRADAGAQIGNFATDIRLQTLTDGALRLFVTVRGDPSVTWLDYRDGDLDCADDEVIEICGEDNRLTRLRNDVELPSISDEPFGLYVDSTNGYAMVTHLTTGNVSLIDAPPDGAPPVLADAIGGLFPANPNTGVRGAVGIAGRRPGTPSDLVYAVSRSSSLVQMLYVYRGPVGHPLIAPSEFFFLSSVQPSSDARGIAFGADGSLLYALNRAPPMLHVIDTRLDDTGVPKNTLLHATEICDDAANLVVGDVGRGERAWLTCFPNGQVWVVAPTGDEPTAIIDVGRGPHSLVLAPTRQKLYVANFLEDTIAVIDLTPGAPTENEVVLRLGTPRQQGEDEGDAS